MPSCSPMVRFRPPVGVVGYEMIAGFNPFGAGGSSDTATVLYRVIHEPAPALPLPAGRGSSIDPCPALMAALSKNPSNRPQTAEKFKALLYEGKRESEEPYRPIDPTPVEHKSWLPYALIAGVGVVVLACMLVSALQGATSGSAAGPADETSGETESADEDETPVETVR